MSHNIYVINNLFITNNYFFESLQELIKYQQKCLSSWGDHDRCLEQRPSDKLQYLISDEGSKQEVLSRIAQANATPTKLKPI